MIKFSNEEIANHSRRLGEVFALAMSEALFNDTGPEVIPEASVGLATLMAAAKMLVIFASFMKHPLTQKDVPMVEEVFRGLLLIEIKAPLPKAETTH